MFPGSNCSALSTFFQKYATQPTNRLWGVFRGMTMLPVFHLLCNWDTGEEHSTRNFHFNQMVFIAICRSPLALSLFSLFFVPSDWLAVNQNFHTIAGNVLLCWSSYVSCWFALAIDSIKSFLLHNTSRIRCSPFLYCWHVACTLGCLPRINLSSGDNNMPPQNQ